MLLVAINAKYIHSNLAIYSLKANAGKYEDKVELLEYTINHRKEEILRGIYEKKPDIIGFSVYIWDVEYVRSISREIRKILPEVKIICGGPEVSYNAAEVLENEPQIDVIIIGEGEKTFAEYLAYEIDRVGMLDKVPGLAFRDKDGKPVVTSPRKAMSMDEIVFCYSDLAGMENHILYYETMRGCPFSCSYCLSSIEKSLRIRSFTKVQKELDFFLENRVLQVKFVDRTFNCNHEHAYQIWSYISEHDNGVTNFHFEIAGDLLRQEDFELFQTFRPGLIQLEIGVQSTNEKTLEAIRRKMNMELLKQNVLQVQQRENIHQHLDLIAGLPYEDYESFGKSFNDVYAMKPDQLQLGFLKVLKGSYMDEVKGEYNIEYMDEPPYEVLSTTWLPYQDVLKLKDVEEMVEVYYNSFQFSASMKFLVRFHKNAFLLYEDLARYYREKELFGEKQDRKKRYSILWDYFVENFPAEEAMRDLFAESLTFDLYQRENVKNPPEFVPQEENGWFEMMRNFFEKEASEHRWLAGYEGLTGKQISHMTHLLKMTLNIDELNQNTQGSPRETTPYYALFDYKNRNPLNHSASVIRMVTLDDEKNYEE